MKKHANLSIFVPHNGCPRQCIFCNQNRISGESHTPSPSEVAELCERFLPEQDISGHTEIAFFGGSFTAIDRCIQEPLLNTAYSFVKKGRASGIRLSTRPDAIDSEILRMLDYYCAHSIELGAQSMDDSVLELNRRGHTSQAVIDASALIKSSEAKFSLGLQMMIGMYGEADPLASALYTAKKFIELKPETVRIYPTVVVENTPLCDIYRAGGYTPLTVEKAAEITARLLIMFERENINVIRIGLHSDDALRESAVAGPFHPAFGEICHTLVMREKILSRIVDKPPSNKLIAKVHGGCISRTLGYKRANIDYFAKKGIELCVAEDDSVPYGEVALEYQISK
ncbi:MAG: radical SAM protein [Oscillospiraceae bacterium]